MADPLVLGTFLLELGTGIGTVVVGYIMWASGYWGILVEAAKANHWRAPKKEQKPPREDGEDTRVDEWRTSLGLKP